MKLMVRLILLIALVSTIPVFADIVPIGPSLPGSLGQQFQVYATVPNPPGQIDRLDYQILTAGVTFESITINTAPVDWTSQILSIQGGRLQGSATPIDPYVTMYFNDGSPGFSTPFTFLLSKYNGGVNTRNLTMSWNNGWGTAVATDQVAQVGQVPDGGATIMLLGSALLGLETLRRRFRA